MAKFVRFCGIITLLYFQHHRIGATAVFNSPDGVTDFNENNDGIATIWTLNVTCYPLTNASDSSTQVEEDCSRSCSFGSNPAPDLFVISGNLLQKSACLTPTCGNCNSCSSCAVGKGCFDASVTSFYDIQVYCSTSDYAFDDSGYSTVTVTVQPETPTIGIDLASSVDATSTMSVNTVLATAFENSDMEIRDFSVVQAVGNTASGTVDLFAMTPSTGEIIVNKDPSDESSGTFSMTVKIYTRRQEAQATITIVFYSTPTFTAHTSPVLVNENTDGVTQIRTIAVTCRPSAHTNKNRCDSYDANNSCTSSSSYVYDTSVTAVDCSSSCSLAAGTNTDIFYVSGAAVNKNACTDTDCGSCNTCTACSTSDGCLTAGNTYNVTVTCSTSGYTNDDEGSSTITVNVTAETPTLTITLASSTNADKSMSVKTVLATASTSTGHSIYDYEESLSVSNSYQLGTQNLFALNTTSGEVIVNKDLSLEYSYTYVLGVRIYSRRQNVAANVTITFAGCFQTPTCNDQTNSFSDQHNTGDLMFDVESDAPSAHFALLSSTWQGLNYSIYSTTLNEVTIDNVTGEISTTGNITVWPDYPFSTHKIVVEVSNSDSCTYTSQCDMDFQVNFTNWPISFVNLPNNTNIHEDKDNRTTLITILTYDHNNPLHDNVTCIEIYNNDTSLFELVHDGNHSYDSWSIVKKECQDRGCGFICADNIGCMNHNITQSYEYILNCSDAYGDTIQGKFILNVDVNEAPIWTNVPNTIVLNTDTVSHLDILFTIFYTDAEKETLAYNYTVDPPTDLFSYDPTGNYYNSAANITSTSFQWDLAEEEYIVEFCGTERRNFRCSSVTIQLRDYCGPTPACNDSSVVVSDEFAVGGELFVIGVDPAPVNTSYTDLSFVVVSEYTSLFTVDQDTGSVTTIGELSTNNPPASTTYYLVANVYDTGACAIGACSLKVEVSFTNYNISITNMAGVTEDIHEDSTAELTLHTIMTSDDNADIDSVTCEVDEANSNPPNNGIFFTEETDARSNVWMIVSKGGGQFDYDVATNYTIVVVCSDNFGSSDTANMIVYILENQFPNMTNLQDNLTINVDPITTFDGDTIFTLQTSDAENDPMEYDCTVTNTWVPLQCAQDGVVSLRRDLIYPDEDGAVYEIKMCINDTVHNYGFCRTLAVNITSSKTYPVLNNLPANITWSENTPTGTTLFTAGIDDPDVGDVHTFSMTVIPDTSNSLFSLDADSGDLTLTSSFNFETETTYIFTFSVEDQYLAGNQSEYLILTVNNTNEGPILTVVNPTINASEGNAGDTVGTLNYACTDPDVDDTLTLSLVSGSSSYLSYINLTNSGLVTYNLDWDFEAGGLTEATAFDVKCEDLDGLSDTATILLFITPRNEFAPVLTTSVEPENITIYSNQSVLDLLLDIDAADDDYEDDNVFEYKIVGSGKGSTYFTIDTDGRLFISNYITLTHNVTFDFTVEVSDGETEPLTSSVHIIVYYISTIEIIIPELETPCILCTKTGIFLVAAIAVEGVIVLVLFIHAMYRLRCWEVCKSKPNPHLVKRKRENDFEDELKNIREDDDPMDDPYRPGSEMLNRALPDNRPPSAITYRERTKITTEPPPAVEYNMPDQSDAIKTTKLPEPGMPRYGHVPIPKPVTPSNVFLHSMNDTDVKSKADVECKPPNSRRHVPSLFQHQNVAQPEVNIPAQEVNGNYGNNTGDRYYRDARPDSLDADVTHNRHELLSPIYDKPDDSILYGDTIMPSVGTPVSVSALDF